MTARSTPPIASRNASTEASMCRVRSSRALESSSTCELRLRLRSIASWKILDRAGQRADLVGTAGVRHLDPFGAIGDAV